jgi:hypothetical protein
LIIAHAIAIAVRAVGIHVAVALATRLAAMLIATIIRFGNELRREFS